MLIVFKRYVYNWYAMEKKHYFNSRMIAATGIITGVEIVLQIIGNYINPGFANINLSLIPIALGAILYGPIVGGFLGFVCGVMVLISPSTMQVFFAVSPVGTVLTCILKTTIAGVVAGFIPKIFKNHKLLSSIIASILVPIINTGLFSIFAVIFFTPILNNMVESTPSQFPNIGIALIAGMIGINFILEIISTVILTPSLYKIIEHTSTNKI